MFIHKKSSAQYRKHEVRGSFDLSHPGKLCHVVTKSWDWRQWPSGRGYGVMGLPWCMPGFAPALLSIACPYKAMGFAVEAKGLSPSTGGNMGRADMRSFSISASCSRFCLARRFWNQIFTWVSVRLSWEENSARSAIDRYCFSLNFRSSERSCWVVKGVRGFRFVLCFRSWTWIFWGLGGATFSGLPSPENKKNPD